VAKTRLKKELESDAIATFITVRLDEDSKVNLNEVAKLRGINVRDYEEYRG
jgi:hypothetical protein